MFGADLVVNDPTAKGETFVLLYSTYNLYSVFLVVSDLVGVKNVSNLKSSIWSILLYTWIKYL